MVQRFEKPFSSHLKLLFVCLASLSTRSPILPPPVCLFVYRSGYTHQPSVRGTWVLGFCACILSLPLSGNMRTCYGLLRLLFHSLELTFVFTGLLQHAHILQIAYVSQSLGLNTPKTVMFHILELTFVFPGLLQHAHMLQTTKTYVPQSLGLKSS